MERIKCYLVIFGLGLLLGLFSFNTNTYATTVRLEGADRYETAVKISKEGWSSSDYVVLVTGENYPDALCASPLAHRLQAPVLLTQSKSLNKRTKDEIKRLKARKIIVIGGSGAISESVLSELRSMDLECIRIYGNDRYSTSVEVAKYYSDNFGSSGEIFVVLGQDYADALSVSSIAGIRKSPVVLVPSEYLPTQVKAFMEDYDISSTYVIGGPNTIADNVVRQLKNPERIYGQNKYYRNMAVLERFKDSLDLNTLYVVTGKDYPDGLAASALASKRNTSIMLVNEGSIESLAKFINDNFPINAKIFTIGGNAALPENLVDRLLQSSYDKFSISGNINHDGFATESEGWLYCLARHDVENYFFYKMKDDGSDKERLPNNLFKLKNLNIVDDWIYYTLDADYNKGIYKMRIDGSDNQRICDDIVDKMIIHGEWIIYTRIENVYENENIKYNTLMKVKTDGTDKVRLTPYFVGKSIAVAQDWVYFIKAEQTSSRIYDSGNGKIIVDRYADFGSIYRINLNTLEYTPINSNQTEEMIYNGGWIYFVDKLEGRLYRFHTSELENELVISFPISNPIISDGWIYYLKQDKELGPFSIYKTSIEENITKRISDKTKDNVGKFNLAGSWIVYENLADKNNHYMIKTDGTKRHLLE